MITFASANQQGEVLEWLKRHAWKACSRQNWLAGSNPVLSASCSLRFIKLKPADFQRVSIFLPIEVPFKVPLLFMKD